MLGYRLRKLRESERITQKQLADRLNIPNQNISNYERDFRQPDYETLRKFAEYFEVTTDYLLGYTDDPKKESEKISKADLEEMLRQYPELYFGERKLELTDEERETAINILAAFLLKERKDKDT